SVRYSQSRRHFPGVLTVRREVMGEQCVALPTERGGIHRLPRDSVSRTWWRRGTSNSRELRLLTVGIRARKRGQPAIVHTEFQLMVTFTPRQIVDDVDLALFVRGILALGIDSGPVYG